MWDGSLAEGVGFEPTEALASHAFQACPFGRSGNPPGPRVSGYGESRVSCGRQRPSQGVAIGTCATGAREPGQGRKAAALSGSFRVPQTTWSPLPETGVGAPGGRHPVWFERPDPGIMQVSAP